MKKNALLCCMFALIVSASALAADTTPERYDMPQYAISSAADYELSQQLIVNGKYIPAPPVMIHQCVLVPARAVADALGFTTVWNGDTPSVTITSDAMTTTLDLGKDLSFASSIIAIGMTAPISYGAPAVLIGSTAYIPADVFRVIQGNSSEAVVIHNDTISIQNIRTSPAES